ncbi:hypothetical protein Pelo_3823 [Pelomyxa schiedti]|nr:hypothetical protein Pelo_3823 [Pelomyxa schiedti]
MRRVGNGTTEYASAKFAIRTAAPYEPRMKKTRAVLLYVIGRSAVEQPEKDGELCMFLHFLWGGEGRGASRETYAGMSY